MRYNEENSVVQCDWATLKIITRKDNMNKIQKKEGFTIIEVVLVLAIAGLIFLMVFIALPALQRSQRDTQRRDDLARVATALTQFQTNNNGSLPANGNITGNNRPAHGSSNAAERLIWDYLNSTDATANSFKDPDGTFYSINISTSAPRSYDPHVIYIIKKSYCNGEVPTNTRANDNDYSIVYKLEGSGTYCADNR